MDIGTVAQHLDGLHHRNLDWDIGNNFGLEQEPHNKDYFKATLFFDPSGMFYVNYYKINVIDEITGGSSTPTHHEPHRCRH